MKNYFTISEFVITGKAIPLDVADKILTFHIIPMNRVRGEYGNEIWVSRNSGYRPYRWEINHGRDGSSQHTFKEEGAADYTASDMEKLVDCLKKYSNYTRICYYPHHGFAHCDYASNDGRIYFEADENKKWHFKYEL